MKRKLVAVLAGLALASGSFAVGEEAAVDATTSSQTDSQIAFSPKCTIFGDIYFTGYVSQTHRGVSMLSGNADKSLVGFKFETSPYSGAIIRFNLTNVADDSTPTVLFKDGYIYSDILGEYGIHAASLVVNAGYKEWNSDYFCPSAMSIDDSYIQDDKTKDRLNVRVDASYNNKNLPVKASFATDLDFGSANNDDDENDAGQVFWGQLEGKQQPLFGWVMLDWNGYFCRYYDELNNAETAINRDHYIDHMGGTVGIDILKVPTGLTAASSYSLPFSIRLGSACEYTRTVTENDNTETSWDLQFGISASMKQLFTVSATYLSDGEDPVYDKGDYNPARYIAGQASFDMIKKLSVYGGLAYQFNETVVNAEPTSDFARLSFETGVSVLPNDGVTITLGWQRGEWGIYAPVRDLTIETGDPSWGQIFFQVHYKF